MVLSIGVRNIGGQVGLGGVVRGPAKSDARLKFVAFADLEVGDTAGSEACATNCWKPRDEGNEASGTNLYPL
jgi:hypothetical protein